MNNVNKKNIIKFQDQICSIGKDLTVILSLIKFLEAAMNGQIEIKRADLQNLISIINSILVNIIDKQDNLENFLEM